MKRFAPSGFFVNLTVPAEYSRFVIYERMILDLPEHPVDEIIEFVSKNFEKEEYEYCFHVLVSSTTRRFSQLQHQIELWKALYKFFGKKYNVFQSVADSLRFTRIMQLEGVYTKDDIDELAPTITIPNKKVFAEYFGKKQDYSDGKSYFEAINSYPEDSFELFIRNDDVDKLELFVADKTVEFYEQKININKYDANKRMQKVCPIEMAALYGSCKVFKFMILNAKPTSNTLFQYAIQGGSNEIIHICESYGFAKELTNDAIDTAISFQRYDVFDYLMNHFKVTIPLLTCGINIFDTLTFLYYMNEGCEILTFNVDNSNTMQRVSYAAFTNNYPQVLILVEKGADVNSAYNKSKENNFSRFSGKSPLYVATQIQSREIIKLLLDHGANPNNGEDRIISSFFKPFVY